MLFPVQIVFLKSPPRLFFVVKKLFIFFHLWNIEEATQGRIRISTPIDATAFAGKCTLGPRKGVCFVTFLVLPCLQLCFTFKS